MTTTRPCLYDDERGVERAIDGHMAELLETHELQRLIDRLSKTRQDLVETRVSIGGLFLQIQRVQSSASPSPEVAVGEVVDRLLEAEAEVAAYQGLAAGACLGWAFGGLQFVTWGDGWERDVGVDPDSHTVPPARRCLYLVRDGMRYEWRLVVRSARGDRERVAIGSANTPRTAMRAADAKARELGWLS